MDSSFVVKRVVVLLLFVGLAASVRVRSEADTAALPFVVLHGEHLGEASLTFSTLGCKYHSRKDSGTCEVHCYEPFFSLCCHD